MSFRSRCYVDSVFLINPHCAGTSWHPHCSIDPTQNCTSEVRCDIYPKFMVRSSHLRVFFCRNFPSEAPLPPRSTFFVSCLSQFSVTPPTHTHVVLYLGAAICSCSWFSIFPPNHTQTYASILPFLTATRLFFFLVVLVVQIPTRAPIGPGTPSPSRKSGAADTGEVLDWSSLRRDASRPIVCVGFPPRPCSSSDALQHYNTLLVSVGTLLSSFTVFLLSVFVDGLSYFSCEYRLRCRCGWLGGCGCGYEGDFLPMVWSCSTWAHACVTLSFLEWFGRPDFPSEFAFFHRYDARRGNCREFSCVLARPAFHAPACFLSSFHVFLHLRCVATRTSSRNAGVPQDLNPCGRRSRGSRNCRPIPTWEENAARFSCVMNLNPRFDTPLLFPTACPLPQAAAGGSDSGDSEIATIVAIVSAAVAIPLIAAMGLCFCCWRRRKKRREGEFKGRPSAAVTASGANGTRGYGRDGERKKRGVKTDVGVKGATTAPQPTEDGGDRRCSRLIFARRCSMDRPTVVGSPEILVSLVYIVLRPPLFSSTDRPTDGAADPYRRVMRVVRLVDSSPPAEASCSSTAHSNDRTFTARATDRSTYRANDRPTICPRFLSCIVLYCRCRC